MNIQREGPASHRTSVLFFPKPTKHRFRIDNFDAAELVCSTIDVGGRMEDPILRGLAEMVLVPEYFTGGPLQGDPPSGAFR